MISSGTRGQAKLIDLRRFHVVVKASEIVPGYEDYRGIPVGPLHHGVQHAHRPIFSLAHAAVWVFTVFPRRHKPTYRGQLTVLCIREKLRGRCDAFVPQVSVANARDKRKKASILAVVFPGNAGFLKGIGECLEMKASRLLSTITVLVNHGDTAPGRAITIGSWARISTIVDDSARLCRKREQMVGKARAVDRSEVVISQSESSSIGPVVGNLLGCRLRVSAPSAATDHIELVHLAAVHRLQAAIPAIAQIVGWIAIRHEAQRYLLTSRDETSGCAVRTGKGPEIVVESVILIDKEDRMLNGRKISGYGSVTSSRACAKERKDGHEDERGSFAECRGVVPMWAESFR